MSAMPNNKPLQAFEFYTWISSGNAYVVIFLYLEIIL